MLANIQLLRAIAALLVVMHHVKQSYSQMGGQNPVIDQIGYFGMAGVDIFFVISGFVIALTLSNSQHSLYPALEYLKKRFFRIYLGYWPAYVAMLVVTGFLVINPQWGKMDLTKSFWLIPLDPVQGKKAVLDVYWTLAFELYFYSLCLLAFFISHRTFNLVMLAYFAVVVGKNILVPDSRYHTWGSFLSSFFILEFMAGWFLYQYRHWLQHRWLLPVLIVGLIIAVVSGIYFDARNQLMRAYTFGVAGVFMVALCYWLEKQQVYKAGRWFVNLGDASYAIYLYHIPLMIVLVYTGFWRKYSAAQLDMPFVALLIFLGLLCSFSILYYNNIEKPLYRIACKKLSFKKIIS